jgi:phospholipase D1/2
MVKLIEGSTDFIYIENQFFQTEFGKPSIDSFSDKGRNQAAGPMKFMLQQRMNRIKSVLSRAGDAEGAKLLPSNGVGRALGARIAAAVRWGMPFHVYIVLPVHPEGRLDDITIVGQIHWTMQSLVFADHSLVNLIRRAIAARKICKNPMAQESWDKAMHESGVPADGSVPYLKVTEAEWSQYLTLLNLRTCEVIGSAARTEQIYIHSKVFVVDDRHVIMGSANINDRSLTGKRDSELAVMLFDPRWEQKAIGNSVSSVNSLARKLRIELWRKLFALDASNEIVQPAIELEAFLERPAGSKTIQAIQRIANANAAAYSNAFPHLPLGAVGGRGVPQRSSIWPTMSNTTSQGSAAKSAKRMPFHDDFWGNTFPPSRSPVGVRGFITQFPTYWTIGENNHPGKMSAMVLTQHENMMPRDNNIIAASQPGNHTV